MLEIAGLKALNNCALKINQKKLFVNIYLKFFLIGWGKPSPHSHCVARYPFERGAQSPRPATPRAWKCHSIIVVFLCRQGFFFLSAASDSVKSETDFSILRILSFIFCCSSQQINFFAMNFFCAEIKFSMKS